MAIAPDGVILLSRYKNELGVRFEPHYSVHHMHARVLEQLCMSNVSSLIETRFHLN
jgi:hypothetical protein